LSAHDLCCVHGNILGLWWTIRTDTNTHGECIAEPDQHLARPDDPLDHHRA
jgi:hypothetical protein